ncbi:GntR family transcriptional regulator [Humitalea rosea]|uniref:GntR family transcriptional regulator n=1 Tax=Humitalea rosea TaxID=990373 RepID=A0A2W7IML7_9PROT|nr:GntR family transcriptional regulator [Humitalea rosea]PZW48090.1 GntR family transcriptional regulator [Humitalea rosea]
MPRPPLTDIAWDPPAMLGAPPVRSLTSAVFHRLRAEILGCRIAPGERLRPTEIARALAVSLSAVREALSRLAADGLVQIEDQKGFRASPVSITDLRDVTRTRVDIEGLALRRAIDRGDAAWEDGIRAALDTLCATPSRRADDPLVPNEAWAVPHERFHLALLAACGSEWLLRFRATLFSQSDRYRRLSVPAVPTDARDVVGEHRAIAAATLARDADAAVAALGRHYETTMQRALAAISEALDPDEPGKP